MHDSETLASLRRNSKGKQVVTPNARDTYQTSRGAALRRRREDRRDESPNSHEVREVNQQSFPLSDFKQAMIHWYRQVNELSGDGATSSYTFAQFGEVKPPTYDGKAYPLAAEQWTRKIEGILKQKVFLKTKRLTLLLDT
ncbi:hypothetical protein ACJRO7_009644 [Eucalyptus globulus]|uniref:Uncharacterized protein n=1 Tax=Eucalyptus globulus TaxID=34317 RepID=A0ABD3LEC4_EUCGL